jgi:hypothetical protein
VDQVDGGVDLSLGFGGEAEDEVALDVDAAFGQPSYDGAGHVGGDAFVDGGEHPLAAGLGAERDFPQPVARQHVEGFVGGAVQDVDPVRGRRCRLVPRSEQVHDRGVPRVAEVVGASADTVTVTATASQRVGRQAVSAG